MSEVAAAADQLAEGARRLAEVFRGFSVTAAEEAGRDAAVNLPALVAALRDGGHVWPAGELSRRD